MWKMEYELRRFLYFKLKLRIKGIRLSRVIVKGFLAVPSGWAVIFFQMAIFRPQSTQAAKPETSSRGLHAGWRMAF